jgi:membrane-associated phospholipid phosphatase
MVNIFLDAGIELILVLQRMGDWLVAPMAIFTFLGNEAFYFLTLISIYWAVNPQIGVRLGLILMLSGGFNYLFKLALQSPRPYWYDPRVVAWSAEATFGVPSGHAQHAVILWFMLAGYVRKNWAWAGAVFLIFFIGISRLYLGVHFPHDVIFGWLAGFLLLVAVFALETRLRSWFISKQPVVQAALAFGASMTILLAALLVRMMLGDWTLPEIWVQAATAAAPEAKPLDPLSFAGVINGAGAFSGLAAGAIWLAQRGGFSAAGPWWKRMIRLPVGAVGAALLWIGLGYLLEGNTTTYTPVLQYLLYALVGFWIAGLAPVLFIKLGLAEPDSNVGKHP